MRRLLLACVLGLACSGEPLPVPADMQCAVGCMVDTDCGPAGWRCFSCICVQPSGLDLAPPPDMAAAFTCIPECPRGTRCTINGCI